MTVPSFVTSWGSHIYSYIQKQIIKRLKAQDPIELIIDQEVMDILDNHPERADEAYEIVWHCEEIAQKNLNNFVEQI